MYAVRRPVLRAVLWTSFAAATWIAASVPSGFSMIQIAMFAGPGLVLAIAASWAAHAAFPHEWNWRNGLRAAVIGAVAFPPFVAVFFAWAGTFGAPVMVTLLVFSAWLAVLGGLMIALVRLATVPSAARRRERSRAAAAAVIPFKPALRALRSRSMRVLR